MKEYLIDVPVLLIFFNRPEKFCKVFDKIKEAKPSKLYLYQDGPRSEKDVELIDKCRRIAMEIDWECEVHKKFQKKNVGCDPSMFLAIKWMFETEKIGIILEDDCVPDVSFFQFCKELLEKYENEERIGMISGSNPMYTYTEKNQNSYIYTNTGAIWGWATWKRVVDSWDEKLSFVGNKELEIMLYENTKFKKNVDSFLRSAGWHSKSGKQYFESIHGAEMKLNYRLTIVPKNNLVTNIGVGGESTHSVSDIRLLPKGILPVFQVPTKRMEFPLEHPKYKIPDKIYEKKINRLMGYDLRVRIWRKCEILLRKALYGRKRLSKEN